MQINYYSLAFSDFRSTKDFFAAFQALQTESRTQFCGKIWKVFDEIKINFIIFL